VSPESQPAPKRRKARQRGYSGVLADRGIGLGWGLGPSLVVHLGLMGIFLAGAASEPRERPRIDRDVFMVSTVVLPKSQSLPTKAAAPKPPSPGETGETREAPPPRPDEMVLPEKKAPKIEGPKSVPEVKPRKPEPTPKPRRDLSSLLDSVEEESDQVVFETSPDGDPNAKPQAGLQAQFGRQLTAYERLVRDAIQNSWFPKSGRGTLDDGLWAAVTFQVDDNGALIGPSLEQTSGDFVYDQSCLRAVQRTRRVEPPPSGANRTITVGFSPKDKR
jgi:TonB family protein